MRLNKQDGGRRQTILVTNNEVAADEQKELREKGSNDVVSTVTAEPAGTNGSYRVFRVTTEAIVPCVVVEDNTLYVETAKGNEIFDTGIRQ